MPQFKEEQGKLVFLKPLQTRETWLHPMVSSPAAGNGSRSLRVKLGNKDSLTAFRWKLKMQRLLQCLDEGC